MRGAAHNHNNRLGYTLQVNSKVKKLERFLKALPHFNHRIWVRCHDWAVYISIVCFSPTVFFAWKFNQRYDVKRTFWVTFGTNNTLHKAPPSLYRSQCQDFPRKWFRIKILNTSWARNVTQWFPAFRFVVRSWFVDHFWLHWP